MNPTDTIYIIQPFRWSSDYWDFYPSGKQYYVKSEIAAKSVVSHLNNGLKDDGSFKSKDESLEVTHYTFYPVERLD